MRDPDLVAERAAQDEALADQGVHEPRVIVPAGLSSSGLAGSHGPERWMVTRNMTRTLTLDIRTRKGLCSVRADTGLPSWSGRGPGAILSP